ncbi:hypothetical protein [Streptomyces sp. NPDC014006]|uniref:hypothetical protein n=1 Tax=Streptomyces sp. NPDC014006 TaxID=3364870 RepID=UPI0037028E59
MVTLPHHWMFGHTPRVSMGFLGLATGATVAGSLSRQGWSAELDVNDRTRAVVVAMERGSCGDGPEDQNEKNEKREDSGK